jgi:hypothetical protein
MYCTSDLGIILQVISGTRRLEITTSVIKEADNETD